MRPLHNNILMRLIIFFFGRDFQHNGVNFISARDHTFDVLLTRVLGYQDYTDIRVFEEAAEGVLHVGFRGFYG